MRPKFIEDLAVELNAAMADAVNEWGDFGCDKCGSRENQYPMTVFLEFGGPDCRRGCGPMRLYGVLRRAVAEAGTTT